MKTVKVRAYKKLGPTGKVEDVDAHLRKLEKEVFALTSTRSVRGPRARALSNIPHRTRATSGYKTEYYTDAKNAEKFRDAFNKDYRRRG